jgi:hypothetical protein
MAPSSPGSDLALLSIAFALALAAAPAPAAGDCALLNLAACPDASALARDPGFQAALKQFVGQRPTGYLTPNGQAYGEALTVLSGPAEPVRRLRGLYLFTACADNACDDQGAVVMEPEGQLAAVAILHSDCQGLHHVGDCLTRQVLSIMRGQDDDLGVIDGLSDWARAALAGRPLAPGVGIRGLDRVEVMALAGAGPAKAPPRAAPIEATVPPLSTPVAPAISGAWTVRPQPAPGPLPLMSPAPPPPIPKPIAPPPAKPPRPEPEPPAAEDAPAAKIEGVPLAGATPLEGVTTVAPRMAPFIPVPRAVYPQLTTEIAPVVILPPPPPAPPPAPKEKRDIDWWKWHWRPSGR